MPVIGSTQPITNLMSAPSNPRTSGPWQPRFGIGGLMLLMFVVCVMASAGYYGLRAIQAVEGGRGHQLTFLSFTFAAPVLLMIVVSLLRWTLFRRR